MSLERELAGHNKEVEDRIFEKYAELRVGRGLCGECNVPKEVNGGLPVSFFVVGEDFQKQESRIMFVGKTVQSGWESEPRNEASGFLDSRKYAKEELFLPFWSTYPFWQCIKEICQLVWEIDNPEEIWRRIAITNLVKCSTSSSLDTTPLQLKRNCIENARFFENEVKIARPTHMILFTGLDYDEHLKKLSFGYDCFKEITGIVFFDEAERKEVLHFKGTEKEWERVFLEGEKVKMRFLRTYHPAFFKKQEDKRTFCQHIAAWIKLSP
jgi:hypothetical protein